jgi:hypothetical protein
VQSSRLDRDEQRYLIRLARLSGAATPIAGARGKRR